MFNGYEVRREEPTRIDVELTHHEVADPFVVCTADFPILETLIPLGTDFVDWRGVHGYGQLGSFADLYSLLTGTLGNAGNSGMLTKSVIYVTGSCWI